jgi:hypothetical protein
MIESVITFTLPRSPPILRIAEAIRPTDPIVLGCTGCGGAFVLQALEAPPPECWRCGARLCPHCLDRFASGAEQRARAEAADAETSAIASAMRACAAAPKNEAARAEPHGRPTSEPHTTDRNGRA